MEFDLNPPAIIGEVVAGREHKVRMRLAELSSAIVRETFDIAELLDEAESKGYLGTWGYSGVAEYGEAELGIKGRRAQYLTRIVMVCKYLGIPREEYEPLGISKLREITSLNHKGTFFDGTINVPLADLIRGLIQSSRGLTVKQVEEKVAKLKGQTGDDARVIRSYSTTQAAWDNVISEAIEIARRKLGSAGRDGDGKAVEYTDGVCIEVICADFIADPGNSTEDVDSEEQYPELPEAQIQEEPSGPESNFIVPSE